MAVTFQSVQIGAFTNGDLVITKPVSLAVGDLLVGVTHTQNTNNNKPSGWTRAISKASDGAVITTYVDWIIATSTEVAATNFTWAANGGNYHAGGLYRITGSHLTNPLGTFATDGSVTGTTSPSFNTTINPDDANSLLLHIVGEYQAGGVNFSVSAQAIATSNPSWTEDFDLAQNNGGSGSLGVAVAHASRPEITGTGNQTATISNSLTQSVGIMLAVRPQILITQSETESVVDTVTRIYMKTLSEIESVVDSVISAKSRLWNKISKNVSSWINQIIN